MSSLKEVLNWAVEILEQSGNVSAHSEVERILMHLTRCQRIELYLQKDLVERLDRSRFHQVIHQRAKGVPLQYLLGVSYFWAWEFKVGPGVFIPRAETEILVEQSLKLLQPPIGKEDGFLHLLDLGTGCGNLAIALTKLLSHCKIRAIEWSPEAIRLARENAQHHQVEDRVCFIEEDWSQFLPRLEEPVDGIIANPPYIPSQAISQLDIGVRMEPLESLDGGEDGLKWIRLLLQLGRRSLKRDGFLIFEMGDGQAEIVKEIALEHQWPEFGIVKDLGGVERVFWARRD